MIITASTEVWYCTECKWSWFKREGKVPNRCPKCRKRVSSAGKVREVRNDDMADTTNGFPAKKEHDTKECRVYRCAYCIALGKKF